MVEVRFLNAFECSTIRRNHSITHSWLLAVSGGVFGNDPLFLWRPGLCAPFHAGPTLS